MNHCVLETAYRISACIISFIESVLCQYYAQLYVSLAKEDKKKKDNVTYVS